MTIAFDGDTALKDFISHSMSKGLKLVNEEVGYTEDPYSTIGLLALNTDGEEVGRLDYDLSVTGLDVYGYIADTVGEYMEYGHE